MSAEVKKGSFFVATRLIPHYKESDEPKLHPHLYTEVVPTSEKQRLQADLDRHKDLLRKQCNRSQELQTLLDEAVTLLGDYRNVCGIKQREKLREFLGRVKK